MHTMYRLPPQKRALLMQEVEVPGRADDLGHDGALVLLHHSSTHLERGLEHGEQVTLVDAADRRRAAVVVDIDFELDDTTYVLRLGHGPAPAARIETVDSVVDLLHDLRRERRGDS